MFVKRIADFQRFHFFYEEAFEFVRDFFRDDESLGRDAGLAIVEHARLHADGDRLLQIRAFHHDKWIAAAQLQNDFLDVRCRGDADLNAGALATGEGCGFDPRIGENPRNFVRDDQQRLENSFGESSP